MINRLSKYIYNNSRLFADEKALIEKELAQETSMEKEPFDLNECSIYFSGSCGLLGAYLTSIYHKELLADRFPSYFFEKYQDKCQSLLIASNQDFNNLPLICIPIGEMGLYGALMKLQSLVGKGFEIDLNNVPILQETIEITDYLDANPYKMLSGNSKLLVFKDDSVECQSSENFAKIGIFRGDKEMQIVTYDEVGLLNRPTIDEYLKIVTNI